MKFVTLGKIDTIFLKDFKHFLPNKKHIPFRITDLILLLNSEATILQTSWSLLFPLHKLGKLGLKVYNLDRFSNPEEPWVWHRILNDIAEEEFSEIRHDSHEKFCTALEQLKKRKHNKIYIFGTGPSLSDAINHNWSDGYTIVCNTIVRDKKLWDHIKPDIIVAGDALYHFSNTEYANKFQIDLEKRLLEGKTYFVYPETFHQYIISKLNKSLIKRLIPIPGSNEKNIVNNICKNFYLPGNENVLSLLLLPLACNVSKNIYLWGFDGRSPKDIGFWANSKKHSYSNSIFSLKKHSPAFFKFNIPANKESSYADRVQGENLDLILKGAEDKGYKIQMLHHTWSSALAKRIIKQDSKNI